MERLLYIVQGLVMVVAAIVAICRPSIAMRRLLETKVVMWPFWVTTRGDWTTSQRDYGTLIGIGVALLIIEFGLWWFLHMLRVPDSKSVVDPGQSNG